MLHLKHARVLFLYAGLLGCGDVIASDSLLVSAIERIAVTNQLIQQNKLEWTAGLTSKSCLTHYQKQRLAGRSLSELPQDVVSYLSAPKTAAAASTPPDWTSWMSAVEDQGDYGTCWAHAATGIAEGLLHSRIGSNIGIDLDEFAIAYNATCGDTDGTTWGPCGLYYLTTAKCPSEQDLSSYPNFDHGYWALSSFDSNTVSAAYIKQELESSPVFATMLMYEDFLDYTSGIYEHTSGSAVGGHSVVIVSYDDDDQYWKCKNSFGTDWGESGYFRIKYGECGIAQIDNYFAAVSHDSCYAKIVPSLISQVNTAMGYGFASDEWAYVNGTYTMTASQTVGSGKVLCALAGATLRFPASGNITVNGTLLGQGTAGSGVTFTSSSGSPSAGAWYSILNYGTVDLSYSDIYYGSYGVRAYSGADTTRLNNCDIRWFSTHGANLPYGNVEITGSVIRDCSSSSSRGIHLSSYVEDVAISSNWIGNLTGSSYLYGIYVSCDNSRVVIDDNVVTDLHNGSTRYGIYVRGDSLCIRNNRVLDFNGTGGYGIYVYAADYDTLRGNRVENGDGTFARGIYLSSADNAVVSDDTVADCNSRGIYCYNGTGVTVADCRVADCEAVGAYGLAASGSACDDIAFDGNNVQAVDGSFSAGVGLVAYDYAAATARRNNIEDFYLYGVASGANDGMVDCGTSVDSGRNNIYWNLTGDSLRTGVLFVYHSGSDSIDARYNYYGSSSPPSYEFYGKIRWQPYLTSPYAPKAAPSVPAAAVATVPVPRAVPHPFERSVGICFDVTGTRGEPALVTAVIYDRQGIMVKQLADRSMAPGLHRIDWDRRDTGGHRCPSGMYWCRIITDGTVQTLRLMAVD